MSAYSKRGNAFSVAFLMSYLCLAQPVASPEVKCIAVAPNGDVTITWITPSDPGGNFLSYKIYSSPNTPAGPYTLAGTITAYTQTFFTDIGAGASVKRVYYLVQTEYNPGTALSPPVDTFSTIYLTIANLVSKATLNWNVLASPNISTSTGWYKIYREYPIGTWLLHDSTKNLTYDDVIDVCNASLSYRIEMDDNTGCTSVSNADGGTFSDNTPPAVAPIDTVSVDFASNKAIISWYPSPSPDADSVIIYRFNGTVWPQIASVKVSATSYLNLTSTASIASESYRIAFKDSCGKLSQMTDIKDLHQTIHLSINFDVCASTADLKWNKYIHWNPEANQYEILKSVNGGTFSVLAVHSDSDTDYVDTGLTIGTSYCYLIRASNGVKTSSSNKTCSTLNVLNPPLFTYNRFATVVSDKEVLITAYVDPAQGVKSYRIRRATGTNGSFSVIAALSKPTGTILTYTDNAVNTPANSYIYKVDAMDSCAHIIETSNVDTTMLLTASIAPHLDITLSWNDYGNWLGKVDYYKIYRAVDGVWDPFPINTVPYTGSGGAYTDDVAPFLTGKGNFSYYVSAVEGSGNTYGFTDSSTSNVARVYQYPKFYVPNAFTPNGDNINDVFLPVIGFIDPGNYSFTVFDRTGTQVMQTANPAEGWDGKKKGHDCPQGVYLYLIQCKASNGDDSKISGTVSLIR